jgi:hypothetical protein
VSSHPTCRVRVNHIGSSQPKRQSRRPGTDRDRYPAVSRRPSSIVAPARSPLQPRDTSAHGPALPNRIDEAGRVDECQLLGVLPLRHRDKRLRCRLLRPPGMASNPGTHGKRPCVPGGYFVSDQNQVQLIALNGGMREIAAGPSSRLSAPRGNVIMDGDSDPDARAPR